MLLYVCRIHGLSFLDVQWYAPVYRRIHYPYQLPMSAQPSLLSDAAADFAAASIHGSALLVLPILLIIYGRAWNKKTILLLMTVIMMILFVHPLTDIIDGLLRDTQYNDIVTNDIWQQDGWYQYAARFILFCSGTVITGRKILY